MDEKTRKPSLSEQVNQPRPGLIAEVFGMLRDHKKWWLTPIIVAALVLGLVSILAGTGAAPFIYTLF